MRLRFVVMPTAAFLMSVIMYSGGGSTEARAFVSDNARVLVTTRAHTDRLAAVAGAASDVSARLNVMPLIGDGTYAQTQKSGISEGGVEKASYSVNGVLAEQRYPKEKTIKIGRGDTVSSVLQKAGLGKAETFGAVQAMHEHLDPKKIRPGQTINLRFDPEGNGGGFRLASVHVDLDQVRSVVVEPSEDGFSARMLEKEVHVRLHAQKAVIENSLFGSGLKAGIPSKIIAEAMRIYSWDVDFQRDLRRGDTLDILYESYVTEDGKFARYGNVLLANLSVGGQSVPVYRYEMKNGDVDYFEPDGRSVRKALMKTPVDGARLSSGFGMRKHPILGYNKMHKGQDFAAPAGTPIYAAGDGVVEKAGRWGAYGNYLRIRHNSELKTAYAHIQRYARGVSAGTRVKQGQVVAYVGTTGRSTGPHLHFEVIMNGQQVNPATVKLPQGKTLNGAEKKLFRAAVEKLNSQYNTMAGEMRTAAR